VKFQFGVNFDGGGGCFLQVNNYFFGLRFNGSTIFASSKGLHIWAHPSNRKYAIRGGYQYRKAIEFQPEYLEVGDR
jgi:hypothetical protein